MRNHLYGVLLVAGALHLGAPAMAQDDSRESLLDGSGKLGTIDWAPEKANDSVTGARLPSDSSGLFGMVLFLVGLGGAGAALVWHVKNRRQSNPKSTARMAVLERLSLGARRELMLVRAGERLLVLASLQNDVRLIAALPNPEIPEGVETDLEHLFHDREATAAQPHLDATVDHSCFTPSLTVDWPTGPARG
jgi:flagellar biogenesis protein FliO